MRKTKIMLATMIFTIAMSTTAFAEDDMSAINTQVTEAVAENSTDAVGPGYQDSKVIRARQMLDDLYANETDQELRNMAVDASMTSIFGITRNVGMQLKSEQGAIFAVGRYSQNPNYFKNSTYMVVSKDMSYYLNDNKLIMATGNYNESNFEKLQSVYSAAQELKQFTTGMCDLDKAAYIHDYICDRLDYDYTFGDRNLAEAFCDGLGVCNDYAGLFYLFGTYCGLNVKNEIGYVNEPVQGYHAWNEVEIDGEWKALDVTWDDTTGTKGYFLLNENNFETSRVIFSGNFDEVKEQVAAACAPNR